MPKYHIITYGCQMNKADSERIASSLEKRGYKPVQSPKEADLIVVNMCSVRQSAVDRVFGMPMKLKGLKTKNYKLKTILTGCILKKDEAKFREIFDEIKKMPQRSCPSTFIPISNGCDNFCSYCVVPFTRGRLICRNHQEILKEVKNILGNPIRKNNFSNGAEVWLLGQNVNDYKSGTVNFAKLVKMVDDIPGDFKFFFMSPNPKNFSDELINTLTECKKFGRRLNLPIQSGDDKILKKMKRNYTVKQYKDLVKRIREKMLDINLSTDVIAGFPGETKKQFENTVKLFKTIKFDIAYVSKYSPRPGTASFKMKDDISREEKNRRAKILMKLVKHPNI
ncbi:MAG: MiaB/RimO family radical SAM methylthiotransferase [Candidatus Nealsonbacteria bacterium]